MAYLVPDHYLASQVRTEAERLDIETTSDPQAFACASVRAAPPYDMCEMGVGAMSAGQAQVVPVSSPASATSTTSMRLRLSPINVQAAMFLRADGARHFAFNWALAQIKANQDQ